MPLRLPQRRNAAYALPALYRKPNPVPSNPTSYSVTQYSASNYTNPYGGGGGGGGDGARPGNALSSLALSLTISSSDIVMPVSASYWATELRTISSKDRGALVFFAFSSSLAAAFAPAASSVAAFFSAACGVQPARQHGERSAGAAMCKLTFFAAFSAAAFSLLNPPRSSDGSGVPSADNPNNACDAVGRESGRTRPAARRTLRRLSTRPRAGSRSEAACPRRSRREIVVRMRVSVGDNHAIRTVRKISGRAVKLLTRQR